MSSIWSRKVDAPDKRYQRVLGRLDLTNIGIAAIIGAGIFVFLGTEAIGTGPAVVFSLLLAGCAAMLAALSYAEAASIRPGNGGAYSFAYEALGNFPAFMVGWLLINGYAIGNAGVGTGWATFFVSLLGRLGITLPEAFRASPLEGGWVNLPSLMFFVAITLIAMAGLSQSKRINNILVVLKLAIVALIIVVGAVLVQPSNWAPFSPGGTRAVAGSTAILFFAYLGFDTIAATGAEAKRPHKDMPWAIIVSISVCTALYVLMALAVTGIAASAGLDPSAPTADAFAQAGAAWAGLIITLGALIGLATVAYAFHIATARIFQAMAQDGFMPRGIAKVDARGVPRNATLAVGLISAIAAGFLPLKILINSAVEANILVFMSVSLGILLLRKAPRQGFKAHPALHVAALLALGSVIAFGIWDAAIHVATVCWLALGMVVYGFWAHRSSKRVLNGRPETPDDGTSAPLPRAQPGTDL